MIDSSKKQIRLLSYYILIGFVLFITRTSSFAQEQQNVLYTGDPDNIIITDPLQGTTDPQNLSTDEQKNIDLLFQRYQEEIINGWESKAIYKEAQLIKTKRDLSNNLHIFSETDQRIQEYTELLQPLEQKITSLKEQIAYLDEQTALTQYKIKNVTEQIIQKQEEIKHMMEDLELAKEEVKNQERILIEYVKMIYTHERQYYDFNEQTLNDVKLLINDSTIAKTITAGEYLSIVQKTGQQILEELQHVYEKLTSKELDLESKQTRLQSLQRELGIQKETLAQEQVAKQQLLETTQGDERKYQELIALSLQEKLRVAEEIDLLKNNLDVIDKELEALKKNAAKIDTEDIRKKAESASLLLENTENTISTNRISFPVPPYKGISAYFKDAGYVATFGVEHGAIDIPIPQGTEMRAPADAYVYKAKDNGYGYSYIILAHRNGFLTVYGHVSKLLVKEGDLVRHNDIIGLSGGAPGTLGAGLRTTGPHLHFEVWKNGKKVDPMLYMDLSQLPQDKVPTSRIPIQQEDAILD